MVAVSAVIVCYGYGDCGSCVMQYYGCRGRKKRTVVCIVASAVILVCCGGDGGILPWL